MYKTGDRARWLADGTVEYLGRLDFQVKLRGFRIELGEIETTLLALDGVREAAAVVHADEPGDERIVAYVVPQIADGVAADELRARLQAVLPDYMVPSAFVFLDALPLGASGKLDRRKLPAPDRMPSRRAVYVAPRTPTEEAVARLWAEVLRVDPVGATDDFLALGGHSLLAMRVIGRVRSELAVRVPLDALIGGATLEQFAARIDAERSEPSSANDEIALAPVSRAAFRRTVAAPRGGAA
jgi:acyl carrier protein